jgi:S1-C subfamily serine protease
MLVLSLLIALWPQDPSVAAVRVAEQRRVEVIARCAPAVCSVMDMQAPGGGSGVVIDPRGYVLTNFHVIGGADTNDKTPKDKVLPAPPAPPAEALQTFKAANPAASSEDENRFVSDWQDAWKQQHWPSGTNHWRNKKVGLPDGELYEAVVLGVDPGSDLAVLRLLPKLDGQTWPCCELGDSDALLVGQTVFAMGNPFLLATDFTPTVTFGIVSGTHRYQEGQGNRMLVYPDCIQVDAAINPGNSGGPLFDEDGKVIGINGRISLGDRGRVNVGVGFAIACNQVRNFLPDLLAGRHAEHGTLDLSAWFKKTKNGDERHGVFVQQLYKDSVAAVAGIKLGDEIVHFQGEDVRSANQLATRIGVLPAGAWIELGYRPENVDNSFGDERFVDIRLARLDTGSSKDARTDTERLSSLIERQLATKAMRARATSPTAQRTVTLAFADRDGAKWSIVRDMAREATAMDRDGVRFLRTRSEADPNVEGDALLQRLVRCNPLLWIGCDRGERFDEALLLGGVHVLGRPAYRYSLPGDGELEFFLFADGSAAGCSLRDPVRREKLELHCDGSSVRVIRDGVFDRGWRVASYATDVQVEDSVFGRPQ